MPDGLEMFRSTSSHNKTDSDSDNLRGSLGEVRLIGTVTLATVPG